MLTSVTSYWMKSNNNNNKSVTNEEENDEKYIKEQRKYEYTFKHSMLN